MKPITCPKCRAKLESFVYQGIEIDRCPKCAGIWLDSLEAERLKMIQGSESVDIGVSATGMSCACSEKELKCPKCHAKMIRMLDIDLYAIWYEQCSKCRGIWFDAGEFKKFKQNFQPKSIFDRTVRVFNPKQK
ncbi:hypothetical protein NIES593_04205 [Hydrococcus rivularis NIES-593]|uniref:Transcription factor zinc-finger domain-containing protein n=1 Tax=Hydrococcus rivularis NIES-593 TaxID=1921803 RepID=A0A1U7HPQ7_9CYAN|nr:zf-TFIIB domain-containing protein [Hydrococcus rivularis]OKH25551.1 hypothetical protein NIES593_04205 [Hydrococcus rivularis NIES-593]